VHYDEIYSDWMSKMPTENLFFEFITFNPLQNKITNDNIYILDSNKNYDIKSNNIISIDNTPFDNYGDITFELYYNIQKVYLFFYNEFITEEDIRNKIIIYNIYHKILNLVDKNKYNIKYPLNFDAIETYLICGLTDKSFFRIGDGQQTIPGTRKTGGGGYAKIVSREIRETTVKILNKNYDYDKNKLFICYNEIYYGGSNIIASKRSPLYWSPEGKGKFWNRQLKNQNFNDVYYSSHCFRCGIPSLENGYSNFETNKIFKLLSKMFINKDIIVINHSLCTDVFHNYNSRIDINYGGTDLDSDHAIRQNVTDFVLNTLEGLFENNPKKYTIFVKGSCLSSLIVDKYYKNHRVCDIGSFKFTISEDMNVSQPVGTIYNL